MERIDVLFRGNTSDVAIPNGVNTTWGELQSALSEGLGVETGALRVFYNKRRVEPSTTASITLAELGWDLMANRRVSIMEGAVPAQIQQVQRTQQEVEAEMRIRATRRVVSLQQRNEAHEARALVSTAYRFHNVEVLENFSDAHRAREILEQLATDRGVLAVMAKHKWTVGCLAEMYPDGKVGVDPVCVLGLNQNKGQKILLRLRTDDLKGFRKFLSIKKVLYHELAHNVHSEHDNDFYQLMRQIEKECGELDWSASNGHVVGGSAVNVIQDSPSSESVSANRLGGSASSSRLLELTSATNSPTRPATDQICEMTQTPPPSGSSPSTAADRGTDASSESDKKHNSPVVDINVSAPQFLPNYEPSEREKRIFQALTSLRQRQSLDLVCRALTLVMKIISNVVENPQETKYQSIRKSTNAFSTRIAIFPECLDILKSVGFDEHDEFFQLSRRDPGLLWVGRSAIEGALQSLSTQDPL
ncbi:hypothetical protein PINS_up000399 [Pythium insidiosum]|nr:hypothetical protein PINS_up000399 [Pythium insidiosum]